MLNSKQFKQLIIHKEHWNLMFNHEHIDYNADLLEFDQSFYYVKQVFIKGKIFKMVLLESRYFKKQNIVLYEPDEFRYYFRKEPKNNET